jgi:hypothetical protein
VWRSYGGSSRSTSIAVSGSTARANIRPVPTSAFVAGRWSPARDPGASVWVPRIRLACKSVGARAGSEGPAARSPTSIAVLTARARQ